MRGRFLRDSGRWGSPASARARGSTRLLAWVVGLAAVVAGCQGDKEPPVLVPVADGPVRLPPAAGEGETAPTLDAAIERFRASFADGVGMPSEGTMRLAVWAASNLTWAALESAKPETTLAALSHGVEPERGKRLCESGEVVDLRDDTSHGVRLAMGVLAKGAGMPVHFVAAGSTEGVAAKRTARLCGIVTGRLRLRDATGRDVEHVQVVGMFDVPQNKSVAAPAPPRPEGSAAPPARGSGQPRPSGRTVPSTL